VSDDFVITFVATRTAPSVANPIANQVFDGDGAKSFVVPANTFSDPNSAPITYGATLANGSALPSWLSFNPGTFQATPPQGFVGQIEIAVTARDSNGREVTAIFKFNVGQGVVSPTQGDQQPAPQGQGQGQQPPPPPPPPPPQGRLGVTDQIRLAGRSGGLLDRLMSSRAVQDRLQERTQQLAAERGLVRGDETGKATKANAAPARLAAERAQPTAAPRPGA